MTKYLNNSSVSLYTMKDESSDNKIISMERARKLIKEGYFAIDPHCHSSFSYDVPDARETAPENVIGMQKKLGLRSILTDHDTLNGYNHLKLRQYTKKYQIVPAVELTVKPRIARKIVTYKPIQTIHINIFRLNNRNLTKIRKIAKTGDLDELVTYFKKHDLDWMYNHPFYHEKKERLNWKVIPALAKEYFDVIEINSGYSKGFNDITQRLAENLNKGIVASSDSHTGNPGRGIVIAKGKNFKEFWKNVKKGDAYIVRSDMGTWDIVREASLIMNRVFKSRIRPRKDRNYTSSTDFEPFDEMMTSVTKGRLKNKFIIKKIVQMILQSLNYIAVPILAWGLHVTKDENKAQKLRNRMHSITNKIKNSKVTNRIRVLENKIIRHKEKNKPKYYGEQLVNNKK